MISAIRVPEGSEDTDAPDGQGLVRRGVFTRRTRRSAQCFEATPHPARPMTFLDRRLKTLFSGVRPEAPDEANDAARVLLSQR